MSLHYVMQLLSLYYWNCSGFSIIQIASIISLRSTISLGSTISFVLLWGGLNHDLHSISNFKSFPAIAGMHSLRTKHSPHT